MRSDRCATTNSTLCDRRMPTWCWWIVSLVLLGTWSNETQGDALDDDLKIVAAVRPNAVGSEPAQAAVERLKRSGPEAVPRLLVALDTTNVVAANWLRTVLDDVAARESTRPAAEWPVADIEKYVQDPARPGRARRWALHLLDRLTPGFSNAWIAKQLDDPEFRGDAVSATIREGDGLAREKRRRDDALVQYRLAFIHARESDQVLLAAKKLRELGEQVDPISRLGFVTRWHLVGPFDAPGTSGFENQYEPERTVKLDQVFAGVGQNSVSWKTHATEDPLGQVDLIRALAAAREAVGYAYSELVLDKPVACQLRCSADDNLTVWINGDKVLARKQWLNGTRLDRFMVPVQLQSGTNRLLVKICQGPQHADPAVPNNWTFQLRFCDATGAGVPLKISSPPPKEAAP
ncbi:MAG: hypothetical protein U1A77_14580 [Pirellulales bacterium]